MQEYSAEWHGIRLLIRHTHDFMNLSKLGLNIDQVEIWSEDRRPLPITETGYRCKFIDRSDLDDYVDVVEFVTMWLDVEGEADRQMSLF